MATRPSMAWYAPRVIAMTDANATQPVQPVAFRCHISALGRVVRWGWSVVVGGRPVVGGRSDVLIGSPSVRRTVGCGVPRAAASALPRWALLPRSALSALDVRPVATAARHPPRMRQAAL